MSVIHTLQLHVAVVSAAQPPVGFMLLTSKQTMTETVLYADIIDFLCNTECIEGR